MNQGQQGLVEYSGLKDLLEVHWQRKFAAGIM